MTSTTGAGDGGGRGQRCSEYSSVKRSHPPRGANQGKGEMRERVRLEGEYKCVSVCLVCIGFGFCDNLQINFDVELNMKLLLFPGFIFNPSL